MSVRRGGSFYFEKFGTLETMSSDGDNSQSSSGGFAMSEHPGETNSSCRAVDDRTGDVCGETEGLRILDQFRKIYEARMEKVEEEEASGAESDFIPVRAVRIVPDLCVCVFFSTSLCTQNLICFFRQMKLKIMKEWIKDLGEQNVMLVQTVEDLEQAACYRVKILEEKLKETAGIVADKMSRLTKPSEDVGILFYVLFLIHLFIFFY